MIRYQLIVARGDFEVSASLQTFGLPTNEVAFTSIVPTDYLARYSLSLNRYPLIVDMGLGCALDCVAKNVDRTDRLPPPIVIRDLITDYQLLDVSRKRNPLNGILRVV